jgi:hypothetical protein
MFTKWANLEMPRSAGMSKGVVFGALRILK